MSTGQIPGGLATIRCSRIFVKTFNHQLVFTWGEQLQSAHMKPPEHIFCLMIINVIYDYNIYL